MLDVVITVCHLTPRQLFRMGYNDLGDEGAKYIGEALSANSSHSLSILL